MIFNPDKFQAIILDKKKSDLSNKQLLIDNQQIKNVSSVELLGIQLDDNLNFNHPISNICRSANQLNALIRLWIFLNFKTRKILKSSSVVSNFNYSLLVPMLSNAKFLNKIVGIHKWSLPFLLSNYTYPCEILLSKAGKVIRNGTSILRTWKL